MQAQVRHERWELATPFIIARETYHHADVVVVTLSHEGAVGRGECTPTNFYGEDVPGVIDAVRDLTARLVRGEDWNSFHDAAPAGAARNAVDCAIWDLRAKQSGRRAWELAGIPAPRAVRTAQTISVGDAAHQADKARTIVSSDGADALIKLKLDANASWNPALLEAVMPALQIANIAMLEQPLPAGADTALARIERRVPVCADESAHVSADLDALRGRYDIINVKLDKTGGLTEALRMCARAQALGFDLMVGCMEGTSLGMAPAMLVAGSARFADLDGPLLIGRDRSPGLRYERGMVSPPDAALWG